MTGVIPLLVYDDIRAGHDFLVEVFGFVSDGVSTDPEGKVVHAEVRLGESRIWLHPVYPPSNMASPQTTTALTGGLVVHVEDVDEHYERARAAGATVTRAPEDQDYGQREYEARDLEGHLFWFATPSAPPALPDRS